MQPRRDGNAGKPYSMLAKNFSALRQLRQCAFMSKSGRLPAWRPLELKRMRRDVHLSWPADTASLLIGAGCLTRFAAQNGGGDSPNVALDGFNWLIRVD